MSGIRRVVTFTVEFCGFLENMSGAKFNAKSTLFASILEDYNSAVLWFYLVLV